jgi:hypothetical protein
MLNPGITSYKDIERKTQELEREGVDIVALDIQEWAIVRSLIEDAHAKWSITRGTTIPNLPKNTFQYRGVTFTVVEE